MTSKKAGAALELLLQGAAKPFQANIFSWINQFESDEDVEFPKLEVTLLVKRRF